LFSRKEQQWQPATQRCIRKGGAVGRCIRKGGDVFEGRSGSEQHWMRRKGHGGDREGRQDTRKKAIKKGESVGMSSG
jgi:hypothetical protein